MLTAEYLAEFYSVCEYCGRTGYEGRTEDPVRDPECAVCLPLRIRVGRRDAEWILQYAMEKLGRLQRPGRPSICATPRHPAPSLLEAQYVAHVDCTCQTLLRALLLTRAHRESQPKETI